MGGVEKHRDDRQHTRGRVAVRMHFREAGTAYLTAEAVEGAALALERVHDVHGRDGLAARVLRVGDRIADHDATTCRSRFCNITRARKLRSEQREGDTQSRG